MPGLVIPTTVYRVRCNEPQCRDSPIYLRDGEEIMFESLDDAFELAKVHNQDKHGHKGVLIGKEIGSGQDVPQGTLGSDD